MGSPTLTFLLVLSTKALTFSIFEFTLALMTLAPTTVDECIFKTLRLQHNYTLEALAKELRVSKLVLIRLEQGTFSRPITVVMDHWVDNYGVNYKSILDAYDSYRSNQRTSNPRCCGDLRADPSNDVHPLRQLRNDGPTALSKLLCVPQATLQYFEKKWKRQQSVPKELIAALLENGYKGSEIRHFQETYVIWRNRKLGRI